MCDTHYCIYSVVFVSLCTINPASDPSELIMKQDFCPRLYLDPCIPVYPQKWVNFLWKRQLSIIQKPSATNEETPITVATLSERPSGGKTTIFDAPIHCQQGFIYCDWAIDIVFDFYRILAKFWLSCSNALSMRGKLF